MQFTVIAFFAFQSTLPAWGVTWQDVYSRWKRRISIHTPRMGSDPLLCVPACLIYISIHTPRMGSDCHIHSAAPVRVYFNPHSPHGE